MTAGGKRRLVFPSTFEKDTFGARRSHVEEAVLHADGTAEAISDDDRAKGASAYVTLHTRAIRRGSSTDFVWLILSHVERETQTVLWAFRAFRADVEVGDPREAVAALRAFAEVYGIAADWGAGGRSRFVEHAIVTFDAQALTKAVVDALVQEDRSRNFVLIAPLRQLAPKQTELRWTFALNATAYQDTLRRRFAN